MASSKNKEQTAHRMLTRKWREQDLQGHYARVVSQKPQVSCHNKTNFPHLIVKPKKIQLIEDRATEIEKNNLNLFNKMRAIIRTKHSTWRNKMMHPTQANLAPRDRLGSAFSTGSRKGGGDTSRSKQRQNSARSDRSTMSAKGPRTSKTSNMRQRPHSRSISSLNSERKRMKDKELFMENVKQLQRLQNAKASFDFVKWDKAEKQRQKLLGNMKQYPEPPVPAINEFINKKPPLSKKQSRRHPSVGPIGSPRGTHGRLPPMSNRGQTPGQKAFRSALPPQRLNSQPMQAGVMNQNQQYPRSKPGTTGSRFNGGPSRGRSRPNNPLNNSAQGAMRKTMFQPANAYGSQTSVNETPEQRSRAKFPATGTNFMPRNARAPQLQSMQLTPTESYPMNNQLNTSTSSKSKHMPPNKFVPLLSEAMAMPTQSTIDYQRPDGMGFQAQINVQSRGKSKNRSRRQHTRGKTHTNLPVPSPRRSKNSRPATNVKFAEDPTFIKLMAIPVRENKQDHPGPHQQFEVAITLDEQQEKFLVVATNLDDSRDYFEIKVNGREEIDKVMAKFQANFDLISESLRIMNDVMVLLNPRMLNALGNLHTATIDSGSIVQ